MPKQSKSTQPSGSTSPSPKPDEKLAYETYFKHKQIALSLEKINNSRLIVFPSVETKGQKDEWWKAGGNSAFIYKYYIRPQMHKTPPTIHPDTDLRYRFKDGFVSLHWKKTLVDNMAKIGYKAREEYGLLIFDLNRTFTMNELKSYRKAEQKDRDSLNQVFRPKQAHPDMYGIIIELSKTIPVKAIKIKDSFRRDFAPELNHSIATIIKTYHRYANQHIDKSTAYQIFSTATDDLDAILMLLCENDCLDVTSRLRIGRLLADFKTSLKRNFPNE